MWTGAPSILPAINETASISGQLSSLVPRLLQCAGDDFQRRAIVITGSRAWCHDTALEVANQTGLQRNHWYGDDIPNGFEHSHDSGAKSLLGSERDLLIFDAHAGFDPDAFGALSGTLRGGGLLLLLAPGLEDWPDYPDIQNERITVAPYAASQITGRYIKRLISTIKSSQQVLVCDQVSGIREPQIWSSLSSSSERSVQPPYRSEDQQHAVEAVIKVVTGHRRRPVVLSADRGRGKSAAFGIAAAYLMEQGRKQIFLTGPSLKSVEAVFNHAQRMLPEAKRLPGELLLGDAVIRFIAPDELVNSLPAADMVLVDEAATIPVPMLETLLKHYSRIAFSTTVHGYEGTGRGFAVRFNNSLDRLSNSWRLLRLETPVRWNRDDPLEQLVFDMLLLNASIAADDRFDGADVQHLTIECLDRDRLVTDEETLSGLFGLLVQAHYRTRPLDLRHLLDGPNLTIYIIRVNKHIAATALVAAEGGFTDVDAADISAGLRRPHGHLLPEALAIHLGLSHALTIHASRITRIAVHPALQGKGIGTKLVQHVVKQSKKTGDDYIGTSFGTTPGLLGFWGRLGWLPVRLGIQRNASSGSHSVLMLHALSSVGGQLVRQARQRFSSQFTHQLSDSLHSLDCMLAATLLKDIEPSESILSEADLDDVYAVVNKQRMPEACIGSLWRLACIGLSRSMVVNQLTDAECTVLVCRLLQKQSWPEVVRVLDVTGKSEALIRLQKAVARLIALLPDVQENNA